MQARTISIIAQYATLGRRVCMWNIFLFFSRGNFFSPQERYAGATTNITTKKKGEKNEKGKKKEKTGAKWIYESKSSSSVNPSVCNVL